MTHDEFKHLYGDLPPYLKVEQAAKILQIGRSKAYALCREYLDKGEGYGVRCVRIGNQIRVPLAGLLDLGAPEDPAAA